ncbi:hypothetical protein Bbelb_119020 [Branchiostoma belcheri]|nr:hypothetical protein Bbelb_119020 [Branchiostoma belcheri]
MATIHRNTYINHTRGTRTSTTHGVTQTLQQPASSYKPVQHRNTYINHTRDNSNTTAACIILQPVQHRNTYINHTRGTRTSTTHGVTQTLQQPASSYKPVQHRNTYINHTRGNSNTTAACIILQTCTTTQEHDKGPGRTSSVQRLHGQAKTAQGHFKRAWQLRRDDNPRVEALPYNMSTPFYTYDYTIFTQGVRSDAEKTGFKKGQHLPCDAEGTLRVQMPV